MQTFLIVHFTANDLRPFVADNDPAAAGIEAMDRRGLQDDRHLTFAPGVHKGSWDIFYKGRRFARALRHELPLI